MTQAMAVKEMVEKAGHEVVGVALGVGPNRTRSRVFCGGHEDADHDHSDAGLFL